MGWRKAAETPKEEVFHGALIAPQQSKFYGEGILWSRSVKGGREQRDSRGRGHGHNKDEEKFFVPRSLQDELEQGDKQQGRCRPNVTVHIMPCAP